MPGMPGVGRFTSAIGGGEIPQGFSSNLRTGHDARAPSECGWSGGLGIAVDIRMLQGSQQPIVRGIRGIRGKAAGRYATSRSMYRAPSGG